MSNVKRLKLSLSAYSFLGYICFISKSVSLFFIHKQDPSCNFWLTHPLFILRNKTNYSYNPAAVSKHMHEHTSIRRVLLIVSLNKIF